MVIRQAAGLRRTHVSSERSDSGQVADAVAGSQRRADDASGAHRRDIDGLRAVAVGAVIWLHTGLPGLSGGFLGVDVFFVISGFLIHRDLTRRLQTGRFSPLAFYGRRMRRTLPALFAVTLLALAAAWFILMTGDYDAMGRSAIATALSVSNILFLNQVGYFDHDALSKPLLHTWSLGVEEQFYLLAPFLALGLNRVRQGSKPVVYVAMFALAFAFCVVLQRIAPPAAFFLMPARAWEFLIGCAIADEVFPKVDRGAIAELTTAIALFALIASFMLVSETSAHPGFPTLVPCIATAAIIHVGQSRRSTAARLLSAPPIAFIGLISYSLYLWHWPIIAFARYLDMQWTPAFVLTLLSLLFILSVLSWRFIETPFRDPNSPLRHRASPLLVGTLSLLIAASIGIVSAHGVPQRFSDQVAQVTSYYDYANRRNFREGTCFLTHSYPNIKYFDKDLCLQKSDSKPNYLLIGDSLAAQFWIGFSTVFGNVNILQATASGCKPTLDPHGPRYCVDLMTYALRRFVPTAHLDGIIFSGAWAAADADPMAATVDYAKSYARSVIVLGPGPAYDTDLPNLLGRSLVRHQPDLATKHQHLYLWDLEGVLKDVLAPKNYVSMLDLLCPAHQCVTYASKTVPLQFDKSHLTTEGSLLVAEQLKRAGLFPR